MRFEQSINIAALPEAVWELLAQTDRLNRELGLPPIHFTFQPSAGGGTEAYAAIRIAGVTLRYREHPFEWARPAFYHVRRSFQGGPIREIVGGATLQGLDRGTRVRIWAEITPAHRLSGSLCRAVGAKSVADTIAVCRRFDAYLAGKSSTPYPHHAGRPPADKARLALALNRLRAAGAEAALAERLADYMAHAPPERTLMVRPFALADSWGVDRMAALETCLHAAKTGMLDLHWRVLCPYCRGGPPGATRLEDIAETVHCETCNIRFDADFDRSVEVCFRVAPAIRPVQEQIYCIGGPGLSPHTVAQWVLQPGERRETDLDLRAANYALTSLQAESPLPITVTEDAEAEAHIVLKPAGQKAQFTRKETTATIACRGKWVLENESAETVTVRLEVPQWTLDAATAALVTSLQPFRDQFGSEALSPGTELAVRQICILFSDLKGSTALYLARGDAPAYRDVREHFRQMQEIIGAHHGGIVKTIGDAVMASFHDPADGLAAALAIQRRTLQDASPLVVKLGLHWGPALVVTANDRLDYFGQTVNLAARLQQESLGEDIVLPAFLAEDPRVAALLADPTLACEPFTANVRGIEEPIAMLRLRLSTAPFPT